MALLVAYQILLMLLALTLLAGCNNSRTRSNMANGMEARYSDLLIERCLADVSPYIVFDRNAQY